MPCATSRLDRCPATPLRRRGLAPLELVLAIPILLFLMALMVNYGTVASWKVRSLTVARNALWASRTLRWDSLATAPRPAYWPANAAITHPGAERLDSLDDSRVRQPIARGPVLTIAPTSVVVNESLLDPTRGLSMGATTLERPFPLMASLGRYTLRAQERLLDNRWQRESMPLTYDGRLRFDALYTLPVVDKGAYSKRYLSAIRTLLRSPCWRDTSPLDRDPELRAAARRHPEMWIPTDFYPGFHLGPTLDKDLVRRRVDELIERITHVPGIQQDMERIFDNLYSGVYD